ncbi:hypothetical protein BU060_10770 [Staphylococcus succinus]|nr:hypothetical protein CD109_11885 [Staphylococcus succinus subsp. succinus]PTI46426.1 hypothetical protein BU060_10770 [Staphylococcus succinus]PTJ85051.1 hypothetical protein BU055_01825 [Staphylococcus succinus]
MNIFLIICIVVALILIALSLFSIYEYKHERKMLYTKFLESHEKNGIKTQTRKILIFSLVLFILAIAFLVFPLIIT